jgi:hypothetical protein
MVNSFSAAVSSVQRFSDLSEGAWQAVKYSVGRTLFRKQMQAHYEFLRQSRWKRGDAVRIDADGGAYAGLVATVDKIDSRGRIEVLLGMIRHTLPADIVVAA